MIQAGQLVDSLARQTQATNFPINNKPFMINRTCANFISLIYNWIQNWNELIYAC